MWNEGLFGHCERMINATISASLIYCMPCCNDVGHAECSGVPTDQPVAIQLNQAYMSVSVSPNQEQVNDDDDSIYEKVLGK